MSGSQTGVLVTGAAGAIGMTLCEAFQAAGYRVIATDRAVAHGACHAYLPLDLAQLVDDQAVREEFHRQVVVALDGVPLRVLVNNAAVQTLSDVDQLSLAAFRHSLDVNLSAPLALVTSFLDALSAQRGVVINIGSVHAQLTKPGFLAYAVSKAALAGLTRSLALDLAPRGIRVNEIRPGATATPMLQAGFASDPQALAQLANMQPLGRLGAPADIAAMAVFLASGQAAFVSGAALPVDGGIGARLHDPM